MSKAAQTAVRLAGRVYQRKPWGLLGCDRVVAFDNGEFEYPVAGSFLGDGGWLAFSMRIGPNAVAEACAYARSYGADCDYLWDCSVLRVERTQWSRLRPATQKFLERAGVSSSSEFGCDLYVTDPTRGTTSEARWRTPRAAELRVLASALGALLHLQEAATLDALSVDAEPAKLPMLTIEGRAEKPKVELSWMDLPDLEPFGGGADVQGDLDAVISDSEVDAVLDTLAQRERIDSVLECAVVDECWEEGEAATPTAVAAEPGSDEFLCFMELLDRDPHAAAKAILSGWCVSDLGLPQAVHCEDAGLQSALQVYLEELGVRCELQPTASLLALVGRSGS